MLLEDFIGIAMESDGWIWYFNDNTAENATSMCRRLVSGLSVMIGSRRNGGKLVQMGENGKTQFR